MWTLIFYVFIVNAKNLGLTTIILAIKIRRGQ